MLLKGSIAVCVLVISVTLGATIDAGARAGPSLSQIGDPVITHDGEQDFGNGTWTVSASGADFDKPDPGGWAAHYTWTMPQTIPPGGVHATLKVNAQGRGAGRTAVAQLTSSSGIAISGDAPHQVTANAEPGFVATTETAFKLIPKSSSGFVDVQIQDGPQVRFYYAAAGAETETVPLPTPGETATTSGKLEKGSSNATVTAQSSDGSLGGTTIVGEGSEAERIRQQVVETTAACWLLGPEAAIPDGAALEVVLNDRRVVNKFKEAEKDPKRYLALCLTLAQNLAANSVPPTPSRASGCARQIVISGKEKNGKVTLKPGKPNDLPKTAVKYGCVDAGSGGAEISVKSSNKKGLTSELGKTLDLGVVRAPDAPATDATLTFGFSS